MSGSLAELIMSIVLTGIVVAGTVIPVTSSLHEYQQAEISLQCNEAHRLAALRIEAVVTTLWHGDEASDDQELLISAQPQQIGNSAFTLSCTNGVLTQKPANHAAATLATSLDGLTLEYLLSDGTWTSSVDSESLDTVTAVRYSWTDAANGHVYRGYVQSSESALSLATLMLEAAEDTDPFYRRTDYERSIALEVGTW